LLTQLALQSRLRSHITLTKTEIMQGALVGVMRQVQNLRDNRQPAYGATTDHDWQWHIEGALGEMALAKALGVFWAGVGLFRGADVVNEATMVVVGNGDRPAQVKVLCTECKTCWL
jgi:hypothetical protein